jgi:hypothetical protein
MTEELDKANGLAGAREISAERIASVVDVKIPGHALTARRAPELHGEAEPVAYRWRYIRHGVPGPWTLRSTFIEPMPEPSHAAGIEVEPLYDAAALRTLSAGSDALLAAQNEIVREVWEVLGGADATREGGQNLVGRVREVVAERDTLSVGKAEAQSNYQMAHQRAADALREGNALQAEVTRLTGLVDVLVASIDGVLCELKPGQSLSPAGSGRTNALESARNEVRRARQALPPSPVEIEEP